jgi:NAD+ diphosphatase
MLGFFAEAADAQIHRNDGELEDARWLSREELKTALERGDVVLPSAISISRRLITQWFNAGTLGPLDSVRQVAW